MKIFSFMILFILLFSTAVFAEKLTIILDQEMDYKGIPLKLLNIGSSGSAILKINHVDRVIKKDGEITAYSLKIKLNSSYPEESYVVLDVEQLVECLINNDCNDDKPCTDDICELHKCSYTKKQGCPLRDKCYEYGSLAEVSGVLSYCGDVNSWYERKAYKSPCQNNFECLSGYCDSICKTIETEEEVEKMAPAWMLIVIGLYLITKTLPFIIIPKKARQINRNYLKFSDSYFRIVNLVFFVIAVLLIIWSLT